MSEEKQTPFSAVRYSHAFSSASPSFGLQDPRVGDSMGDLRVELERRQIQYRYERILQCPYFAFAMNALIGRFLALPTTEGFRDRILFLDNDIIFEARDALRLVTSDAECIGADYMVKDDSGRRASERNGVEYADGSLSGASRMGTGFLCMSRTILERMAAKAEHCVWDGVKIPKLFSDEVIDGRPVNGDAMFFRRLQEAEGSAWIDRAVHVGHVGVKVYG